MQKSVDDPQLECRRYNHKALCAKFTNAIQLVTREALSSKPCMDCEAGVLWWPATQTCNFSCRINKATCGSSRSLWDHQNVWIFENFQFPKTSLWLSLELRICPQRGSRASCTSTWWIFSMVYRVLGHSNAQYKQHCVLLGQLSGTVGHAAQAIPQSPQGECFIGLHVVIEKPFEIGLAGHPLISWYCHPAPAPEVPLKQRRHQDNISDGLLGGGAVIWDGSQCTTHSGPHCRPDSSSSCLNYNLPSSSILWISLAMSVKIGQT